MTDTPPTVGPDTADIDISFGALALAQLTDQQRQALEDLATAFETTTPGGSDTPGLKCPSVFLGDCEVYLRCKGVVLD